MNNELENVLRKNRSAFHEVIVFKPEKEKLYHFDFTSSNNDITGAAVADTQKFSQYVC